MPTEVCVPAASLAEATDREISNCVARLPSRSCSAPADDLLFATALRCAVFDAVGRRSILVAARKVVRSKAMNQPPDSTFTICKLAGLRRCSSRSEEPTLLFLLLPLLFFPLSNLGELFLFFLVLSFFLYFQFSLLDLIQMCGECLVLI